MIDVEATNEALTELEAWTGFGPEVMDADPLEVMDALAVAARWAVQAHEKGCKAVTHREPILYQGNLWFVLRPEVMPDPDRLYWVVPLDDEQPAALDDGSSE